MPPAFANLLFSGPCNLHCHFCIGRHLPPRPPNLHTFPPRQLDTFLAHLASCNITQLSLTATNTDPLLYQHGPALIRLLRQAIPHLQINLHTNGLLALSKLDYVHACDRICLSLPSLSPQTFLRLTGSRHLPPLARLVRSLHLPLKISSILLWETIDELPALIQTCQALGVRRLALRKPMGMPCPPLPAWLSTRPPNRFFANNPVYELPQLEVTVWDFERTSDTSINLHSDGAISWEYALSRAPAPTTRSG